MSKPIAKKLPYHFPAEFFLHEKVWQKVLFDKVCTIRQQKGLGRLLRVS